ncbi:MAG: hypothetical protein IJG45_00360 [Oscillospiraceae bacterium]|nr:hypothetical protein [Oscillospiraceae bacterium]
MHISYRTKIILKKLLRVLLIILAAALIAGLLLVIYLEPFVVYDRAGAHLDMEGEMMRLATPNEPAAPRPVIENPQIIYASGAAMNKSIQEMGGYYITTAMLQDADAVFEEVKKIEEPCAVMIQLKSRFGNSYYSSSISGAQKADVKISVIDQMITYLSNKGFYLIAEIPAFTDPVFALDHQECGLAMAGGYLWMDEYGCYWLDPANEEVLSHLSQIARELAGRGFHEVAFSEYRFPDTNSISYYSEKTRSEVIADSVAQLTSNFAGSTTVISFVSAEDDFPVASCTGRMYVKDVAGSKVTHYQQTYGAAGTLEEIVYIVNSRDTRFEDQAVLRPLIAD